MVGKGYEWFISSPARYKAVQGSKDSKKTKTVALVSTVKFLCLDYYNAMYVREFQNTHLDTTKEQIEWSINLIDQFLNIPNYTIREIVRGYKNPIRYEHKIYGTQIKTFGFDTNNANKLAGLECSNGYFCDFILDEAVEEGAGAMEDFEMEEAMNMLNKSINTVFRGKVPAWVERRRTFWTMFNPWTPINHIKQNFFEGYISEDLEQLLDTGQIWRSHPNFRGGLGLLVGITNYRVNEFTTPEQRASKEADKDLHPKRYLTEHCGITAMVANAIFSDSLDYVVVEENTITNYKKKIVHIGIGCDYASKNDKCVFTIIGWTHNYKQEITLPQKIYTHRNLKVKKTQNFKMAQEGIQYITKMLANLEWNTTHTLTVNVDDETEAFIEILKNQYKQYREWCKDNELTPYRLKFQFPNDSGKKRQPKGRKPHIRKLTGGKRTQIEEVNDEKILMEYVYRNDQGDIVPYQIIDAKNTNLLRELNSAQWNETGTRIQGADDSINARWYARIKHRLKLFMKIRRRNRSLI